MLLPRRAFDRRSSLRTGLVHTRTLVSSEHDAPRVEDRDYHSRRVPLVYLETKLLQNPATGSPAFPAFDEQRSASVTG